MDGTNIRIVEEYLEALNRKDLTNAPVADNVRFSDPMAGEGEGLEALLAFVSGFYPAMHGLRIIQHIADGEFVVTEWEVDGVFGTIPVLEKFRVRDGKIVEFHAFYDPRPVLG